MANILKKLKKLLRSYRGLATIGTILLILSAMMGYAYFKNQEDGLIGTSYTKEKSINVMVNQPTKLILQTMYLCGTETVTKEFPSVKAMEVWLANQQDSWELKNKQNSEFTMVRKVEDDLSPMCKSEGYFGLSEEGVLTIFQGPPSSKQVIQTFFRLDTELLESKLPEDEVSYLKKGIRVNNVAEYFSILSTLGEFAVEY